MGRRKGMASIVNAIARDMARSQRRAETERKRQLREHERQRKAIERQIKQEEREERQRQAQSEKERKQLEKEAKQQYLDERLQETEDLNAELADTVLALNTLLEHTLPIDDTIEFASLRVQEKYPAFSPPQELTRITRLPSEDHFIKQVKPMGLMENALGMKGRYQRDLKAAKHQFNEAMKAYQADRAEKKAKLDHLKAEYDVGCQAFQRKVMQRDQEVTLLEQGYNSGEAAAIITYNTMVLERSEYPDGFPQNFRLAYANDSQELVIEYELPWIDVIPTAAEYKYIKTKDAIEEKAKKFTEIKALYQDIVAAVTLRTIHEILEADQGEHIQVVTFNGMVNAVDPATGQDIRPCLISVRTIRERFMELNLARIDKLSCLRNLGAQISARPDERLPVKPVVEFDMVDKRFVDQDDILSGLDARPNLMDLNPSEFENLVSNLFGKLGLETKLTRMSRDNGVDAIAYDTRPVLGGKVVIQAKRYKNVVGVSAVRDLYGTMLNEGASKGILVTTSGYGPDAYDFSSDKPLELIDGGGLLYLLDQVGIEARIIMPQE
ncbi:MAG: restriction endonuclease [Anaerolineae bacterium]|nr:restriction endonuclease [Anaerolineae bacterium]